MSAEDRDRLVRRARRLRLLIAFAVMVILLSPMVARLGVAPPLSLALAAAGTILISSTSFLLGMVDERLARTPVVVSLRLSPSFDEDELDLLDFDRYVHEHSITSEELPAAFAAWLHEATGWDGRVERVDPRTGDET